MAGAQLFRIHITAGTPIGPIYRRHALAQQTAQQLLNPGVLDEGLRSGLFLSGPRRIGKTTFLLNDLIPALEAAGALVIYVDLWSDARANPATLVRAALHQALTDLQTPASALLGRLQSLRSADIGAFGFKFAFKIETVGDAGGQTWHRRSPRWSTRRAGTSC